MRKKTWAWAALVAIGAAGAPRAAWADEDGRFARPPGQTVVVVDVPSDPPPIAREPDVELARSAARVAVGPVGVTTGKGLGLGIGGALDIGRGSVGGRLSVAWTRGEPGAGSLASESFAQYAGELVLDLKKRGPIHPLLGIGFGVVHAEHAGGVGYAGVGLLRGGLEYALGFDETDVRLGVSASVGLVGPADRELADLRAHGLLGTYVAIGL